MKQCFVFFSNFAVCFNEDRLFLLGLTGFDSG